MSIMVVALSEHVGSEYGSQSYLEHMDNVIRGIPQVDDKTYNEDEDTEEFAQEMATIFEASICTQTLGSTGRKRFLTMQRLWQTKLETKI